MQGTEHYVITPRADLLAHARRRPGDFAELMTETVLLHKSFGRPAYPPNDYDAATHIKALFLAYLVADYGDNPSFHEFWDGAAPTTVEEFDRYWTIEVTDDESVDYIECTTRIHTLSP